MLWSGLALAPEFAVHPGKQLEQISGRGENQPPSHDGHRRMTGVIILQGVELGEFKEEMILHPPTMVTNPPNRLAGIAVQSGG